MVVKHVGPLSVGKICFALYGLIGLLAGLFFASFGFLMANAAAANPDNSYLYAILGRFMGLSAIVLFPVVYAVIGFIGGVIFAALYNVVAKIMGGIEVDIS